MDGCLRLLCRTGCLGWLTYCMVSLCSGFGGPCALLWVDYTPTRSLAFPQVVCSSSYLGFPLRVNARLPVICVEVGEADGSANQHSSRYRPSIIPTVFSPLLTSHSCPPFYLLAQSPEPSGVPGQIVSLDFLLAFQKAVWLPAPFRLPCGVFWAVAFPACLIH